MSEARNCIYDLDHALREFGEVIQLQRLSTDPDTGARTVTNQANCRAVVRAHQPQELVPMSGEAPNTLIIMSPTDLSRAMWPGLPVKDDRVLIGGSANNIEIVAPFFVGGTLVRLELQARGEIGLVSTVTGTSAGAAGAIAVAG